MFDTSNIPPGLTSDNYKNVAKHNVERFDKLIFTIRIYLLIADNLNPFPKESIEAHSNSVKLIDSPTKGSAALDKMCLDPNLSLIATFSVNHQTLLMKSLGFSFLIRTVCDNSFINLAM